jgi:hypothetical protein
MKNTDNTINGIEISEELFPTNIPSLPTEIFNKFIESLITENPELKKLSLIELKDNPKFQQALQEYLIKNTTSTSALDILKSIIPKNHIKPNNKLANKMTKNIVDEGEFDLVVSGKKAKKEVLTKVMLYYDENKVKLSGREKFMPYDREVYDGIVSLYEAGNELITPTMVYRAMNGLTETEKISLQALESVTKSLDKSRFIRINIDYTEEAKLYNKHIEKTKYEGYLLAAEKITIKISGEEHEGYKLLRKPILYEYAQISGQIITVPSKLLQTKDAVRGTDEVIVIRGYLLRQIEWIKSDKTNRGNNYITYQGIYQELGILKFNLGEVPYKKKTAKIRSHVKAVLDEWINEGYILKYEEYKEGKSITGVTITPV